MSQGNKINWQTKKLGEVCDIFYGTRVVRKKDGGSKYDVYGGGGKTFFMDTYNRKNQLVIARFAMSEKCVRFIEGKFFLNDSGLTVNIKNKKEIYQEFLNHYFIFLNDHIYSLARGTAQKNLDVPAFRNLEIPLLPFPEQRRIVEILDEVFEKTGKAKENAERNLKNTKELFESYLQNIFVNQGKDWEEKRLGEVCKKTSNIKWQDCKKEKFKYIDLSAVSRNDFKITSSVLIDYKDAPSRAKKIIKKDDVIFATTRPTLKRIARIFNEYNNQICSTGLVVLRASKNKIFPEMIFYFLQTSMFMENMKKLQRGASYPAVSDNDVKNQIISFPKSLSEQKSIVAKLDSLSAETKKLESIYKQKLLDLEELKKSVLKKAFEGEL